MYRVRDGRFEDAAGGPDTTTIRVSGDAGSDPGWSSKQAASLDEYIQGDRQLPGGEWLVARLYTLFQAHLANCLSRYLPKEVERPTIIDVGCGISLSVPSYMGDLSSAALTWCSRSYRQWSHAGVCLHPGLIGDPPDAVETRFDVSLFSTSLRSLPRPWYRGRGGQRARQSESHFGEVSRSPRSGHRGAAAGRRGVREGVPYCPLQKLLVALAPDLAQGLASHTSPSRNQRVISQTAPLSTTCTSVTSPQRSR
jgi:hypothetical protein